MAFFAVLLLLVLLALFAVAATQLWNYAVVRLVWRPYAMSKWFREQGIHGPSYSFLKGCNEDVRSMKEETDRLVLEVGDHKYLPRIAPHYLKWRTLYGEPFLYWHGPQARICIFDYELARQILSSKSGHFVKNDAHPTLLALVGKGLGFMEGADWVRHRRIINPVFTIDKLKMMTKTMLGFAESLAKELEDKASQNKNGETKVDINKFFSELTVDNISYAIFGSSYKLGNEVFRAQTDLLGITMETFLDVPIPGFKYLPTEKNRRKWMLERKLKSLLTEIIQPRLATSEYGNDLLGVMLDSCIETKQGGKQVDLSLSMEEIIHECKLFFFAGHENTSLLLTCSILEPVANDNKLYIADDNGALRDPEALLACSFYAKENRGRYDSGINKTAQRHGNCHTYSNYASRQGGLGSSKGSTWPASVFNGTKVLHRSELLYVGSEVDAGPDAPEVLVHSRDKEVWGDDADEFNPLRFKNGITGAAKVPHGLLAFSMGPRSCIGQNFSMLEAKSTLALMLQKFSFTLSPDYVHAPVDLFTLKPKFGLPVFLRPLDKCN
uniref:Secologanin synthase n=1 Tax=Aegilops tauschii TaxID=37682 RepID=N1QU57_AEGTA